jgi:hypothetical protein
VLIDLEFCRLFTGALSEARIHAHKTGHGAPVAGFPVYPKSFHGVMLLNQQGADVAEIAAQNDRHDMIGHLLERFTVALGKPDEIACYAIAQFHGSSSK